MRSGPNAHSPHSSSYQAMQILDTDTIQAFARDGAVVLRGVLTTMQQMQLEMGIEENLSQLSPLAIVASEPTDPGYFVEDFCTW
jgi:hypothetical protein